MNPIERLCYQGDRGMGALEYRPATPRGRSAKVLRVNELVRLASTVLARRRTISGRLDPGDEQGAKDGLNDLLMVGTSAGGASAKCVIAYNEVTRDVRSGQVPLPEGYSHWLLKLDGVSANGDKELSDPCGYDAIEHAYYEMALDCGIEVTPSLLFRENGRAHFMTKRFDRVARGEKRHMQSLCAHADIRAGKAKVLIQRTIDVFSRWKDYATRSGVFEDHQKRVAKTHRLTLAPAGDSGRGS